MKKIIFIGPIASTNEIPKGGYEAANRRNIDNLSQNFNLHISELPYPQVSEDKIKKIIDYFIGFTRLLYKLIIKICVFKKNKQNLVCHITGLYKQFIYIELIFVLLCNLLNVKVLYEVRAGSMFKHYYNRSWLYKMAFRMVIKKSEFIGIEGLEYHAFLNLYSKYSPIYLPNYVDKTAIFKSVEKRKFLLNKKINLIYFGRLAPEKGIEVIIETFNNLLKIDNKFTLEIIGNPVSDEYLLELESLAKNNKKIKIISGLPQGELFDKIKEMHFFIFPTRHSGEGHSNALTEAMANGCVPICSDCGFNKSVVGACGKILPLHSDFNLYTDAIEKIIHKKKWYGLSKSCILRIQQNYHKSVIIDKYFKIYDNIY